MHRRTIDIVIAGQAEQLASILSEVHAPEGYRFTFSTIISPDPKKLPDCDIFILNHDNPSPLDVPSQDRQPLLVLCLDIACFSQLPESMRERLADFWPQPFSAEMIRFRFQKLVGQLIEERKFRLNQNYLDTLIDSVPDLIWFKRLDGIHVKVNTGFCQAVYKDRKDIEGFDHYHIWGIPKEVYENSDYVCLDTDSIVIESKQPGVFDETVAGHQGMRQLKTYKSPLFDERGELIGTVGIAQDVTELKNTDAKLELILRTMPFAVMITDLSGQVLTLNQKFEEYFQVNQTDLAGKPYPIREATPGTPANPPHLLYLDQENGLGLLCQNKELILDFHTEPIYDYFNNFVGTLHIFRNVTMERGLQNQLRQIAYTDQLTGLFTRRHLFENIGAKMTNSDISLLYIDLDNFKLINDSFGHHYGDMVLKKVGRLLQQFFPNDACVRMGGDEFLIVLLGKSEIEALKEIAEQLIQTFKFHFPGNTAIQPLSVSVGIAAMAGDTPVNFDELLRKSDLALYRAKNCGKEHCVVYTLELEKELEPILRY